MWLEDLIEGLGFFLIGAIGILLIVIFLFATIVGISYLGGKITYNNYTALEKITLDGKIIYSGAGRDVEYTQLGENGNNYSVNIYAGGYNSKFFDKVIKTYVGKELKVESVEGGN